jgi:hypothetical protein
MSATASGASRPPGCTQEKTYSQSDTMAKVVAVRSANWNRPASLPALEDAAEHLVDLPLQRVEALPLLRRHRLAELPVRADRAGLAQPLVLAQLEEHVGADELAELAVRRRLLQRRLKRVGEAVELLVDRGEADVALGREVPVERRRGNPQFLARSPRGSCPGSPARRTAPSPPARCARASGPAAPRPRRRARRTDFLPPRRRPIGLSGKRDRGRSWRRAAPVHYRLPKNSSRPGRASTFM